MKGQKEDLADTMNMNNNQISASENVQIDKKLGNPKDQLKMEGFDRLIREFNKQA
jgi:hypothetical protein